MLQPYTTDELVEAVRRDTFIATSDENWTSARILGVAQDCILEGLAPRMKNAKANYFLQAASVTLVASVTAYDVPGESMWNGVSSVQLRQLSDGMLCGKLSLIEPENLWRYGQVQNPAIPSTFYVDNTQLNVFPAPDSNAVATYDLRLTYYRRPAQMVLTSQATVVQSVTALSVTTSAQPSYFSTNAPDPYTTGRPSRVDVYNRLQPYTRRYTNLTGSITSSTGFTFNGSVTSAQVAKIQSGDILCVYGTTIFPDVPPELHPYLRRLTSATIRLAQGDPAYQAVIDRVGLDVDNFLRGMNNRTDGTAKKLSLAMSAAGRVIARNRAWWTRGD